MRQCATDRWLCGVRVWAVTCSMTLTFAANGQWGQTAKLVPEDIVAGDNFGWSIAVGGGEGDTLRVAVYGAPLAANGPIMYAGSAYLFDLDTGAQLHKLVPDDPFFLDAFGFAVATDGEIVAVSSPVNDEQGDDSGAVYVFDVASGAMLHKIMPDDSVSLDEFGFAVAMDRGLLLVGSLNDDDGGIDAGSAYLFDAKTGEQLHKFIADDARDHAHFGSAVALAGATAIISARDDDNAAGQGSGAVYLFDINTGAQIDKIIGGDVGPGDSFGFWLAASGNLTIVGAPRHDSQGDDAGAAYIFNINTSQQLHKVSADDAASGDNFGCAVAINGALAMVGALRSDMAGVDAGTAYVFDVITGEQLDSFAACDADSGDQFAVSVAISGDGLLIGANRDDQAGADAGAGYTFGPGGLDCNANGQTDECDIANGVSSDCNGNGIPDECEIAGGFAADCNDDGVLDECEEVDPCPWDLDDDCQVGGSDILVLLGAWGSNQGHEADIDGDGVVGPADLLMFLGALGGCP